MSNVTVGLLGSPLGDSLRFCDRVPEAKSTFPQGAIECRPSAAEGSGCIGPSIRMFARQVLHGAAAGARTEAVPAALVDHRPLHQLPIVGEKSADAGATKVWLRRISRLLAYRCSL